MKQSINNLYRFLVCYGFDAKKFFKSLKNSLWFLKDYRNFRLQIPKDSKFHFSSIYPILTDRDDEGGTMNGHYFHQDLLVARKIFENNPVKHLDIGSRTDGFVAHVASFREIELIDIRPINSTIKNISFRQADLMNLPEDLIEKFDSISSLHAIEHFGLGRYGDPIDFYGHEKAIKNISKLIIKGGNFYFSAPIGPLRIEFNAQRVFSIDYLLNLFFADYDVVSFSYVDDLGDLHVDSVLSEENIRSNFGCTYGCGIFHLARK